MRLFSSIYLLLLTYIIIAIVFWGNSLQKQSERIYSLEVQNLRTAVDSAKSPVEYTRRYSVLEQNLSRRTKQYIGEGSAFLVVIIIGATIVYSSFRRKIILSRQQNNFMLSVTHELKSPIAAIKLNLQTIEKHKLNEERRTGLISKSITEANRLNDLCNNILFASQLEGRQYKATREKI